MSGSKRLFRFSSAAVCALLQGVTLLLAWSAVEHLRESRQQVEFLKQIAVAQEWRLVRLDRDAAHIDSDLSRLATRFTQHAAASLHHHARAAERHAELVGEFNGLRSHVARSTRAALVAVARLDGFAREAHAAQLRKLPAIVGQQCGAQSSTTPSRALRPQLAPTPPQRLVRVSRPASCRHNRGSHRVSLRDSRRALLRRRGQRFRSCQSSGSAAG